MKHVSVKYYTPDKITYKIYHIPSYHIPSCITVVMFFFFFGFLYFEEKRSMSMNSLTKNHKVPSVHKNTVMDNMWISWGPQVEDPVI